MNVRGEKDQSGRNCVRGVGGADEEAVDVFLAREHARRDGEHGRRDHRQRHDWRGQQEQHRHEDQLCGDRVSGAHRELDPLGGEVGEEEHEERPQ